MSTTKVATLTDWEKRKKQHLILRLRHQKKLQDQLLAETVDLFSNLRTKTQQVSTSATVENPCYGIAVNTLIGKTINIKSLRKTDTIQYLKHSIAKEDGVPVEQQRLIFAGKQLEDNQTLADYNIGLADTVHMVLRLRGGMYASENDRKDYEDSDNYLDMQVNMLTSGIKETQDLLANLEKAMEVEEALLCSDSE